MIRVHSFDVYDTLLTRPILFPTDLFYFVALKLKTATRNFSPIDYMNARQKAENLARISCKPRDDCQFVDIYKHFNELSDWGISTHEAMEAELDSERKATRPIAINLDKVRSLVEAGETVVFLSDMYLPGGFIWELLCKHVVTCKRESVLTSGDLGLAKYSGRLYEYVMASFGIAASELQHIGDNKYSDFQVPRRLGIYSIAYRDIQPTRYERLHRSRKKNRILLSSIGGLARASRLSVNQNGNNSATVARIASNVIAPLLTSFVAWVLSDARTRGIERLYFISRDGQIFFKIANILRREGDPECRYMYGSRQAWYLPSVIEVNTKTLDWAWPTGMSRSGDDILRRLEIDTAEIRTEFEYKGFDALRLKQKLDDESFVEFRSLLLTNPFSKAVLNRARIQRTLTQEYLCQEGMLDGRSWAIVDIGWTLKCQRALGLVLASAGFKEKVRGYYLGVGNHHIPIHECGPCYPFVTPPDTELNSIFTSTWFFKLTTVILIEHLFTIADHPTVRGYQNIEGRIQPIFKHDERNTEVVAFGRSMHEMITRYASELKGHPLVDPSGREFRERAFSAMATFCMHPEADDVKGVAWLPTNKDQSHDKQHVSQLASALELADLWSMLQYEMVERNEAFFKPHFSWFAGSVAISPIPVRWTFYALYVMNQIRKYLMSFFRF